MNSSFSPFPLIVAVSLFVHTVSGQDPALPAGLGGNNGGAGDPPLPAGLFDDSRPAAPEAPDGEPGLAAAVRQRLEQHRIGGFIETRWGYRLGNDPHHGGMSIGEIRMQLEHMREMGPLHLSLRTDLLYDHDHNHHRIHLERGDGWMDIRAAAVAFTPHPQVDVKIGRHVLTWGTGDLVFINDLFPKDWKSFFIGRDTEYLKAPSDAVRVSMYPAALPNLDIVYTPRFDADRHIDGTRLSYWNPLLQRRAGQDDPIETDRPDRWFRDDEWAARVHGNVASYELAGYFYSGYWKSPSGIDPATGQFAFPKLSVYGASIRGPLFNGIAHAETGYYDSRDDRKGTDPTVANSEFHALVGYEQEVRTELTATVQYYIRHMMQYGDYRDSLPPGARAVDETRHEITLRLRQMLMQQTLELNLFTRFSPSEDDGYIRPVVNYKITDDWAIEAGANLVYGRKPHTFLGQLGRNDNAYIAARYSF